MKWVRSGLKLNPDSCKHPLNWATKIGWLKLKEACVRGRIVSNLHRRFDCCTIPQQLAVLLLRHNLLRWVKVWGWYTFWYSIELHLHKVGYTLLGPSILCNLRLYLGNVKSRIGGHILATRAWWWCWWFDSDGKQWRCLYMHFFTKPAYFRSDDSSCS